MNENEENGEELGESELGKIEYWERCYETEIKNFNRHGDPGEIWFGSDIVKRLLKWLNSNIYVKKDSQIIDLGCGNGMLLVELANEGFTNLKGVDYSKNAISLCNKIAEKYKIPVTFHVGDILNKWDSNYDIIIDKGTYDAISLSKDAKVNQAKYMSNVHSGLENGGFFVIVSCNWTQKELTDQFSTHFKLFEIIPTPQFQFGGKIGNLVTICVFQK